MSRPKKSAFKKDAPYQLPGASSKGLGLEQTRQGVGGTLRKWREESSLTLEAAAKLVNLPKLPATNLQKMEHGKRPIERHQVEALGTLYKRTKQEIDWLAGEVDQELPLGDQHPVRQVRWAFDCLTNDPSMPLELANDLRNLNPSFPMMAGLVETYTRRTGISLLRAPERAFVYAFVFGIDDDIINKTRSFTRDSLEAGEITRLMTRWYDQEPDAAKRSNGQKVLNSLNRLKTEAWQPPQSADIGEYFIPSSEADLEDEEYKRHAVDAVIFIRCSAATSEDEGHVG